MPRRVPDLGLWRQAVRDVTPLPGRARPEPVPMPSPAPNAKAPLTPAPAAPGFGIDRANAERLKRGRHPIAARLDLHGLTQSEAHRALAQFVSHSRAIGRRCVLVITGRGLTPTGPGVLKAAVPRWLAEPEFRHHILMTAPAQPKDGGAGALYVLLRRSGRR